MVMHGANRASQSPKLTNETLAFFEIGHDSDAFLCIRDPVQLLRIRRS